MKTQSKIEFPKIIIRESNDAYDFLKNKVWFPEKVAQAKESLKGVKLPKSIITD
jgi:hypothetical protein